ncbi:hypothetical protein FOQG_19494 [Fusarium oxysporum f. sp. raphani 54005]|uniref:Uncharacterized protein n=1 Tax=Fusarium oxysporum f. sp. raphani 54005 TaxID=1089458 RepID=X0B1Y0_FUSOX|nr:hypothetical protein FOQG_19494 [Fusarium oxysporum f. sp. raphani 54005]
MMLMPKLSSELLRMELEQMSTVTGRQLDLKRLHILLLPCAL